jgi:hypothetical protein
MAHMAYTGPVEPWASAQLRYLSSVRELEIAAPRVDAIRRGWTPVWVVVSGDDVFVRTWQRRDTGWYGRAVKSGRAAIRVAGESVDVIVTVTGVDRAPDIDSAYRAKYGAAGGRSMVTTEAVASTLRLALASRRRVALDG